MGDVIEKEDSYQVKADLPGMKKEDIKVSLDDKTNVLALSATKSDEVNHDTDTYKRRERHFGSVSRSVRLPENSNLEGIDCEYQDGVLSLQIPKLAPIEEDTRHEEQISFSRGCASITPVDAFCFYHVRSNHAVASGLGLHNVCRAVRCTVVVKL